MTQRLIVPVDGSDSSWKAADVAIALARRIAAKVHIVQVAFSPRSVSGVHESLEKGLRSLDPGDVEVELDVRLNPDSAAAGIEQLVELNPGATVVMASHGRGRSAALVGSVAEDVLHRMFGPIMLVGPHTAVDDFSGPVVVSVDGSRESEAALPLAAAWAIELGSTPWVVNVVGEHGGPPPGVDVIDSVYPARLSSELSKLSGHTVEFEELHEGHPELSVPHFADSLGASLIVASSHGRSGLSRLTMGSVTSGFVRHATCPVLIVRLPHPVRRWDEAAARAWAM